MGKDTYGLKLKHVDEHGRLQWETPHGHTYYSDPEDPFDGLQDWSE